MLCRLLLLDDHPALLQGLHALFAQEPDLAVVGTLTTAAALFDYLDHHSTPDLLLLDLHLPAPHHGLALLPLLRRRWPQLRVLVFSSEAAPALVAQVRAAGASGFLNKAAEADELLAAIRAVNADQTVFPAPAGPALPAHSQAKAGMPQLTAREREIMGLVRQGLSTQAIADHLSLSPYTISTHRRNLLDKLGLHTVPELLRFAHEMGL